MVRLAAWLTFFALLPLSGCGGGEASGVEGALQCRCVRDSFISGFLDRTVPDGEACNNSAVGGCSCLASTCQNYCAFEVCQPECAEDTDCPESFECNELVDVEFETLGMFCEFVPPCPEGTTGCPCGPDGECSAFGDRLEPFCDADDICQVNDLCTAGCRQDSVCCGGVFCGGNCIGTPCCS
ncbi:MAG: hypothetical protein WBG86_00875 [Polyangiales bacterium]